MSDFTAYSKNKKVDHCYGLEEFAITDEDIENLKKGKILYTTINADEYALVLKYKKEERSDNDNT